MGHGGNHIIPNAHFRKDWQLRVKTWFDQPAKKLKRRNLRAAKAKKVFPRPVEPLRPVVHAPTSKYNMKTRAGRGFSLDELKEAGITRRIARTVGVAVDHRRRNKSQRTFKTNVQRLKLYKSKLVVFPVRKPGKKGKATAKKLDAPPAELAKAAQLKGTLQPVHRPTLKTRHRALSADEKLANRSVFAHLRRVRADARLVGIRKKRAEEKKNAPAAAAKKEKE